MGRQRAKEKSLTHYTRQMRIEPLQLGWRLGICDLISPLPRRNQRWMGEASDRCRRVCRGEKGQNASAQRSGTSHRRPFAQAAWSGC